MLLAEKSHTNVTPRSAIEPDRSDTEIYFAANHAMRAATTELERINAIGDLILLALNAKSAKLKARIASDLNLSHGLTLVVAP